MWHEKVIFVCWQFHFSRAFSFVGGKHIIRAVQFFILANFKFGEWRYGHNTEMILIAFTSSRTCFQRERYYDICAVQEKYLQHLRRWWWSDEQFKQTQCYYRLRPVTCIPSRYSGSCCWARSTFGGYSTCCSDNDHHPQCSCGGQKIASQQTKNYQFQEYWCCSHQGKEKDKEKSMVCIDSQVPIHSLSLGWNRGSA